MKYFFIFLMTITWFLGNAQDPHFSNFKINPLQLNPSFAGQIPLKSNRLIVGSRGQWPIALGPGTFQTHFVSFDKKICAPLKGDFVGIGGYMLGDKRGDFPLNRYELYFSGVYMKRLVKRNTRGPQIYLGVGGEIGMIHHNLGQKDFVFDEHFDNPDAPGETFDNYNFTKPDLGAGANFYYANEKATEFAFNLGVSIKHLLEPKYNFVIEEKGNEARLVRKTSFNGGVVIPVSEGHFGISINSLLLYQRPFSQLMLNMDFVFEHQSFVLKVGGGIRQTNGENTLYTGTDALVFNTSINWSQMIVSLSYDGNISPFRPGTKQVGALEFSLGVLLGRETCKNIYCNYF